MNLPAQIIAAVRELEQESPPEDAVLITRAQLAAIERLWRVARRVALHPESPAANRRRLLAAVRQLHDA